MRAFSLVLVLSLILPNTLSASADIVSLEDELVIERQTYEKYAYNYRFNKLFASLVAILHTSNDEKFFKIAHQEHLKEKIINFTGQEQALLIFFAYTKKGYSPIVRWLLSLDAMKKNSNISGKVFRIGAEANDLPAVLRCCWEKFIKEAVYEQKFKDWFLARMPNCLTQNQQSVEFLQRRFIKPLDWDNYQEQAHQLDANITLNTAIEFNDHQLLHSALCKRPDFSFEDEFGELPLIKAQRISDPFIIKHLEYYNKYHNILMTILENAPSEKAIKKIILCIRKCPALAFLRNSKGDTVLHLALLTGSIDLVYEVLSCCPAAIAIPNNAGDTPIHLLVKHNGISQPLLDFMQQGLHNLELEEKKKLQHRPSIMVSTMRAVASVMALPFIILKATIAQA
jgi:hypothetical protein